MEDITQLSDDQVFARFRQANEGSPDRARFGGEIMRRQFRLSQKSVEMAEASARAAKRSSYAAMITALAALLTVIAKLFFDVP